MRDTLIVLNYQREIPPFAQTVLHYADSLFNRIIYVTPQLNNDNREACRCKKLQVVQIPRRKWRKAFWKLPYFFLQKNTRRQITEAIRHRMLNHQFIKNLIIYGICGEAVYAQTKEYIEAENLMPESCVLLAAWFHVEAFAGGRLKERFSGLRLVSYAHAFEINEAANPQALFSMNEYKHSACDEIGFIAKTTQQRYLARVAEIYPQVQTDNTIVSYLGSEKKFPNALSQPSGDGIFRLVSCSSAVPVKRIHLIVEALEKCKIRIHWTHLGGGPLLSQLEQYAGERLSEKDNVTYEFTGMLQNSQVQAHYADCPVDLFVNVSESEGLPVSVMECLSYGIPVVATDVGGSKEVVTEATGFLMPKDFSVNVLSEIIEAYAALDGQKKNAYRSNSYAFWQEKLDGSRNTEAFLSRQLKQ